MKPINSCRFITFTLLLAAMVFACNDGGSQTDSYAQARTDCVARINAFRATVQLAPLEQWTDGERCADGEAGSDSRTGTAHGAFGDCEEMAQNECPGWASVDDVVTGCLQMMWDEGPGEPYSEHGHYINMTNTAYSKVACGFHTTAEGSVWAVQNFR